jgi:hypothetical protein
MTASTGKVPGRIFMSYRREDTAYPAGWLYDRLAGHFARSQVFKDIDSIELGDDFVEVITTAVGSCDVLLALIGDRWLALTGQDGRRRLDNPDDFVRLEIEAALARNVRVIPILVEGARMPRADELPTSLAKLARRQALELSPSRFDVDIRRLLGVLERTITEAREQDRRKAEEEAARHRQRVEQLQGQIRERAAAQDWEAVVAASGELAVLDPAAADPDGLASAAREKLTRRREAEEEAARHRQRVEQPAEEAADSDQTEPPLPPRLELSATMVDFGRVVLHSESPERRVRLGNASGGSLDARAATQADWLKLRQDGDVLVVSIETTATGEYESTVTVASHGDSATFRVHAHVVALDASAGEDTDVDHDRAAPDTSATSANGPVPLEVGTPQDVGISQVKQPPRIPTRAWILGGAFTGIVVIVLIVVLASLHTPSQSPQATNTNTSSNIPSNTPTNTSSKLPFKEDFSGSGNDWTIVSGVGSGRYSHGDYQISLQPTELGSGYFEDGLAIPLNVPILNPAPSNVTIEVSASPLTSGVDVSYGIVCRASTAAGYPYYDFLVDTGGYALIEKVTLNNDTTLAQDESLTLNSYGTDQLKASCTTMTGQNAVHLIFWVDGQKVLDVTDRTNPISSGSVGIYAESIAQKPSTVQFDNFAVMQNLALSPTAIFRIFEPSLPVAAARGAGLASAAVA